MPEQVDLYDGHYGQLSTDVQREVRAETYDEDLGQSSWITAAEGREWFDLLGLDAAGRALEVACGSGGMTCAMARHTGASCTGIDINPHGIEAATARAARDGLASRVTFELVDGSRRLPYGDASFDAVFSNDAINHLPNRAATLQDWARVLRPGGRLLFTDPCVVTGPLTSDEMRERSAIGFYLFMPAGLNEPLLKHAGLDLKEVRDVTGAVATVSRAWHDARARRRARLVTLEGDEAFQGLQRFLTAVHVLSSERRLSRFMYLAEKRA